MFRECESLKTLNISNFKTNLVIEMSEMFEKCTSLESLDLSSFDVSRVQSMNSIFLNCDKLKTLDLSKFVTSTVFYIENAFSGCKSLISLDLSNFITTNVANWDDAFYDCNSLKYINLYFYKGKDIFESIPSSNMIYCINNDSNINNNEFSLLKKNSKNICTNFNYTKYYSTNENQTSDLPTPIIFPNQTVDVIIVTLPTSKSDINQEINDTDVPTYHTDYLLSPDNYNGTTNVTENDSQNIVRNTIAAVATAISFFVVALLTCLI